MNADTAIKLAQSNSLPKYIFRSVPIWVLSEWIRGCCTKILAALVAVCIVCSRATGRPSLLVWFIIYILFLMPAYFGNGSRNAVSKHVKQIREEVIRGSPGMNCELWDLIAENVNEQAYRDGDSPGRYCFYSGFHCHNYFREAIVCPYNDGQENSNPKNSPSEEERELRNVMSAYERSLQKWWENFSSHMSKDGRLEVTEKIPLKHVHYSKFVWTLYKLLNGDINIAFHPLFYLINLALPSSLLFSLLFGLQDVNFPLSFFCRCLSVSVLIYLIIISPALCFTRHVQMGIHSQMLWWAIISSVRPKDDEGRWELVAKIFNDIWDSHRSSNLSNVFYDGQDCKKMFMRLYPAELLEKRRWTQSNRDIAAYLEMAIDAVKKEP